MTSDDQPQEAAGSGMDTEYSHEELVPALPDAHREQAANDYLEAQGAGVGGEEPETARVGEGEPVLAQAEMSRAKLPHRPQPQTYACFRSQKSGAVDPSDIPSTATLRRVLALARELEGMLDERPDLLDRRLVANNLLDEVERELRPEAAIIWVPREDNIYEAYATSGLDVAAGIRVPQEQSLFSSFQANVDAVLIERLDVSQRPVAGIPGLIGESLVAGALRLGETLLGVVIATGARFTAADRDRLALLASQAAPAFALAELIGRLRARTFVSSPATTNGTV